MKTNHYIKELIRYDINATSILEWYEEAFDENPKSFNDFVNTVGATIYAGNSIIKDMETKIKSMPVHMIEIYAKEQQALWYNNVINNPTSYSMNDTAFDTICGIIFGWWLDMEHLQIARRGIVAKLVYNWLMTKDVGDKNTKAKSSFSGLIQHSDKEELLKKLHSLIDASNKGVDVAAILSKATLDKFLIRLPNKEEAMSEFRLPCTWEAIRKNLIGDEKLKGDKRYKAAQKVVIFE